MEEKVMPVKMVRCNQGHYYDPSKNSSCPYCGVQGLNVTPHHPGADDDSTQTIGAPPRGGVDWDREKTIAYFPAEMGFDPVVGWLVCIEGLELGRDYRIKSENNFIGRSTQMPICIQGDELISREKHAIISFEPRNQTFTILPGESRGLIYLNNTAVYGPMPLNPYDVIEMGRTKLVFVPLCGEKFQWQKK
jgi:hypothetical protein